MRNLIFKPLFLLAMAFFPLLSFADNSGLSLIVSYYDANGQRQTQSLLLDDKPELSFDKDEVTVESSSVHGLSLVYSNVIDMHFEVATKIRSLSGADKGNVTMSYLNDHTIKISGIKPSSKVNVFTTGGAKISPKTSVDNTSVTLDFGNQPNGIYIVKINNQTFKVIKK